jgi:ribonuclease D
MSIDLMLFFFRKPKIFYIDDQQKLDELIEKIWQQTHIAIDTEFYRKSTYYPKLCLIQIEVNKSIFLIDCLCGLDLQGLWQIIASNKICKILHSGSQDVQIFYQYSKQKPQAIIDTQIMANFCCLDLDIDFNIGYARLAKKIINKKINKDEQNSNWQQRPLTSSQIKYAANDVIDLVKIKEKLEKKLKEKNLYQYLQEEMQIFVNDCLNEDYSHLINKILNKHNKDQHLKLMNLVIIREKWAKIHNKPRQYILSDDIIANLKYPEKLKKLKPEITSDIEENINNQCDQYYYINNQVAKKQKALKKIAQQIAEQKNICPQLLLSNKHMYKIINQGNNLASIIGNWRYSLIGIKLEKTISLWKNTL